MEWSIVQQDGLKRDLQKARTLFSFISSLSPGLKHFQNENVICPTLHEIIHLLLCFN